MRLLDSLYNYGIECHKLFDKGEFEQTAIVVCREKRSGGLVFSQRFGARDWQLGMIDLGFGIVSCL